MGCYFDKDAMITKIKELGYQYIRDLGGGGQGTCFEVTKIEDEANSSIAIKISYKKDTSGNDKPNEYVFWKRHKVLGQSGRMVQVHFSKLFEIDGDDFRLIEMDLMKGTIGDLLNKGRKFTLYEIVYILKEVCSALVSMQIKHLYHGDIKPSNMFYDFVEGADNRIKLGDFGCSYFYNPDLTTSMDSSSNMHFISTPHYSYPERGNSQIMGKKAHCAYQAVDTYAVGVSLYQMLGGSLNDINDLDVKKNLDELERIFPSDDEDLKQIFLKACHPDATKRYLKAKDMEKVFQDWLKNHPEEGFIARASKEELFDKALQLVKKENKTTQEINNMKRYFIRAYDLGVNDAGYYLIRLHDKKVISITNDMYDQICNRLIDTNHRNLCNYCAKQFALRQDFDQAKKILASIVRNKADEVSLYNYALLCMNSDDQQEVYDAIEAMKQLQQNGFKPAIDFLSQLEK